ncbi:endonuclease NucS domain-containing protein [Zobellia laminariae]|uniref:endonuclease NucS domain-containing protein n=1 Tax=Zobellia laminariae TaxID=248906 RepID=UPI0026F41BFD|nr:endonuclease NucS domain-containing protein [Zobellia laminariae]WKX74758.1 endonuclease NucS [Zobellia laminariae]
MDAEKFKNWLEFNGKPRVTIQNRISNCRNVENYEGDLDQHFIKDYGLSLLEKLSYSTSDERDNAPAKHKIPINGNIRNGSATLKQAVNLYMSFKKDNGIDFKDYNDNLSIGTEVVDDEDFEYIENSNNFSYEKDLKTSMVSQIGELFPEYKIYGENNEGIEYLIKGKRIDILLEKNDGSLLTIELKSGTANYKVFGQISMYIGLLMNKFPERNIEGIIVAGEIDESLRSAVKISDRILLKTYKMKLELNDN